MSRGRLGRNLGFKLGAELVARLTKLVVVALAARWLGPEEFGLYTYAFALAFLMAEASDLGLHLFLAREIARAPEAAAEPLGRLLSAKLALAAVSAGIGVILGAMADTDGERHLIWLLAVALLLGSGAEAINHAFRGFQRLGFEAITSSVNALLGAGLGLAAVLAGGGALGLAAGLALGGLGSLGTAVALLSRLVPPRAWLSRLRLEPPRLPPGFMALAAAMVMSRLYFQLDILLLEALRGPAEVAQFGVALKPIAGAMALPMVLMAALFPAFAAASVEQRRALSVRSLGLLAVAGALTSCLLWLFGERFVLLVFGPAYSEAVLPLQLLGLGLIWMFPDYALGQMLFALDLQRAHALLWLGCIALLFAGGLLTIPTWGATGAAATKAAITLGFVLSELLLLRRGLSLRRAAGQALAS